MLGDVVALYIHIPFCATKCPYCDFNTYSGIEALMPAYVEALKGELQLWGTLLGRPRVATIFFGGGTPSYLGSVSVEALLTTARQAFAIQPEAESTLEANPDDLTLEVARAFKALEISRLSIGVQSFDDRLLQALGRRHSAEEAATAYRRAREAGFGNINLDLMFGLPNQTLDDWAATLSRGLRLAPEHLSLYCLTLEQGTPLEQQVRQGLVPEPDSDLAAEMYLLAEEKLEQAGYLHYEISNWALPGYQSRHNLIYWRNGPYLGVGPGAHSSLQGRRFANLRSPRQYIRRVQQWQRQRSAPWPEVTEDRLRSVPVVQEVEEKDLTRQMGETMMMGLRLDEGVSGEDFRRRFRRELSEVYGREITELLELGLVEWRDGALRLSPRSQLLGNEVFARFLG